MKAPFAVAEQARRAIAAHPELVQDDASQECAMVFALVAEGLKGDQAKEWTKRLGSVFIFEIIDSPAKYTLDLLDPPRGPMVSLGEKPAARGQTIQIRLSAKELLGVAVGERLPVRLWANKRIQIKGDVEKALALGRLLSLTRGQVYADAHAKPPQDDFDRSSVKSYMEYDGAGAGSGGAEVGTALGAQKGVVRAKL